jgi:histidinol dehydrogenase
MNWRNRSCSARMPLHRQGGCQHRTPAADHAAREVIAASSLKGRGALIQVANLDEACEIANRIAPEHLELSVSDPGPLVEKIRHAGAIFIGHYASESLGDYCAGPNHVLPTSRSARFSSPLGVYDFQKRSSIIEVSAVGAKTLGPIAATLAHGEGLTAHANGRPSFG